MTSLMNSPLSVSQLPRGYMQACIAHTTDEMRYTILSVGGEAQVTDKNGDEGMEDVADIRVLKVKIVTFNEL